MLVGWEGNRRSGQASQPVSTYGLSGLRRGDEQPAYTPHGILLFVAD